MVTSCASEEAVAILREAGIHTVYAINLLEGIADAACQAKSRTVALVVATPRGRFIVGYTMGSAWWYEEVPAKPRGE
jgi:hypothetical protein